MCIVVKPRHKWIIWHGAAEWWGVYCSFDALTLWIWHHKGHLVYEHAFQTFQVATGPENTSCTLLSLLVHSFGCNRVSFSMYILKCILKNNTNISIKSLYCALCMDWTSHCVSTFKYIRYIIQCHKCRIEIKIATVVCIWKCVLCLMRWQCWLIVMCSIWHMMLHSRHVRRVVQRWEIRNP